MNNEELKPFKNALCILQLILNFSFFILNCFSQYLQCFTGFTAKGHKKIPIFFRDRVVFWALKRPLKEWEGLTIFRRAWLF